MSERLPPVCSPDAIRAAYRPGLRIVWETEGVRDTWEVVSADEISAVTRIVDANGVVTEHAATFEELSSHSSFPMGTTITEAIFETPAGRFTGLRCVLPDGERQFYFSARHPGPPMKIVGSDGVRQQVERFEP